jgi:hypothetical protein
VFDGATGKLIKDGGKTLAEVVPANNSITNAILADVPTNTIKGRVTAGSGDPQDLTAAQALTVLKTAGVYARDNILGTVGQAAGVPTGAIIERGSNANGSYVKFADGTLICMGSVSFSGNVATTYGSIFATTPVTGSSYPAAFTALPSVAITPLLPAPGAKWAAVYSDTFSTTQWPNFLIFDGLTRTGVSGNVQLIAIGRWF